MKKFRCIKKDYINEKHHTSLIMPYEQGIVFNNGVCKVGVDVWRFLDKADFPSHKINIFGDIEAVKEEYYIISKSGKILYNTPTALPKKYQS